MAEFTIRGASHGCGILIVEDEAVAALFLRKTLERQGHTVRGVVPTAEAAVAAARRGGLSVILMDIMLRGEMDGVEAARAIREFSDVPVIYVTGNSDACTSERAMATHPLGVLDKPVDMLELSAMLRNLCSCALPSS